MKLRGVVQGQTVWLDTPAGLPEGQRVELDIRPVSGVADPSAQGEHPSRSFCAAASDNLETRIATDRQFENIRRVDQLRDKIARELGSEHSLSVQYIREDRSR